MNLPTYLDATSLNWDSRIELALATVETIKREHEKGKPYCDFKSQDIIVNVSSNGGIVCKLNKEKKKWAEVDDSWDCGEDKTMRQFYAAPEYYRGESLSSAASVFTLGLVLAEIFCEGHPYKKCKDEESYKNAILSGAKYSDLCLGSFSENVRKREELVHLISRCLAPMAGSRPSLDELYNALQSQKMIQDGWCDVEDEVNLAGQDNEKLEEVKNKMVEKPEESEASSVETSAASTIDEVPPNRFYDINNRVKDSVRLLVILLIWTIVTYLGLLSDVRSSHDDLMISGLIFGGAFILSVVVFYFSGFFDDLAIKRPGWRIIFQIVGVFLVFCGLCGVIDTDLGEIFLGLSIGAIGWGMIYWELESRDGI